MSSREEILADFQACTGIEDVELAICQLQAADWILVDAVNKAMPQHSTSAAAAEIPNTENTQRQTEEAESPATNQPQIPMSEATKDQSSQSRTQQTGHAQDPPLMMPPISSGSRSVQPGPVVTFPSGSGAVSISDDFLAGPSSSFGPRTRMLDFYIQHLDRQIHLKVPDNEDVKTLKNLIQNETGFPPCQQTIRGFKNTPVPPTDKRKLSELNLPKENFLHLITPEPEEDGANGEDTKMEMEDANLDFRLEITDETCNKNYTLNFRPTQTVLSIKLDIGNLTTIPVSKQVWTGWPENVNDDLSLAQLGIPKEHKLLVNRQSNMPVLIDDASAASGSNRSSNHRNSSRDGDSDDDFEDASSEVIMDDDIEIFGSSRSSSTVGSRIQPLIPDDYGDDALAGIKFAEEFSNRYGSPHPAFFPGSLDDAIRESCQQPAKERKMLAIYLHHDSSVLANVFCTQALCAESVVAFLNENFVTFGWDLTFSSNKQRLLDMIKNHFGSVASATIRNLAIEKFPLLALVYKLRGTTEIFQIVHGNVTLDELMSQLLSAHDTYSSQLIVEVKEEDEREARNAVKREQDLAFEIAQQADREKEEQKRREEEAEEEKRRVAEAIRKSEEEAKQKEDERKERNRQKVAQRLPKEPDLNAEKTARIRFRVVGGETTESKTFERRFLASDTLQTIFDYLTVEGFAAPEDYKVISSWPRRDLSNFEDTTQTLEALKLFPQETLTLEEK